MFQYHDDDGTQISAETFVRRYAETIDLFCREHPDFLGAKLVFTSLKFNSKEQVRTHIKMALSFKEQFPDLIAAFDLAGPEDTTAPLGEYADIIREELNEAAARGVHLPLTVHAGETNIPGAQQVIDAVALGCSRIGHGFALARFPSLTKDVIALGTALECCPISNQVLGYIPNLAAHPALGLLRAGVPLTISPDDPGMWCYSDVSYDFAAVVKAWDLGLAEIKSLCRASLLFSTLDVRNRDAAVKAWEATWERWIEDELRRFSRSRL